MPHQHSDEELSAGLLHPKHPDAAARRRPPRAEGGRWSRLAWLLLATVLGFLSMLYWAGREAGPQLDYDGLYLSVLQHSKSGACVLPRPDPFDSSIQRYISAAEPLVCKTHQPDLTSFDVPAGRLSLNHTALAESGFGSVRCSYQCFRRNEGVDDVSLLYDDWVEFESEAFPKCEFFHVSCSRSSLPGSIHANIYAQVLVKPSVLARAKAATGPGVLLLVVDSVSKSNAVRNLPALLNLLRHDFHATLFDGYAKVGDNSFPNAVAFFTGKQACIEGFPNELPCDNSKSYFDDWPLIWKDFNAMGYPTFFAEDYPNYNLFNYLSNGFKKAPTDAYFRPFWLEAWPSFLHRRSTHLCLGSRHKMNAQLSYLESFLRAYAGVPSFALDWQTEIGHDWLNQVALGDADMVAFLRRVAPLLKDTVVVVMADHGHRFDSIRESVIGRIEERMPLFAISLPKELRKKHPEMEVNLAANSQILSSHFDLYVTLRDLLAGNFSRLSSQADWSAVAPRGQSLLRPLPPARTCAEAGIAPEFCICQHETELNVTEPRVRQLADVVLGHVSELLAPAGALCAPLRVSQLHNAQTFLPNQNMVIASKKSFFFGGSQPSGLSINYRVTFEVSPSWAILEGTVRQEADSGRLSVVGDVSRVNRYGNESVCVHNALLRKFCFCS